MCVSVCGGDVGGGKSDVLKVLDFIFLPDSLTK